MVDQSAGELEQEGQFLVHFYLDGEGHQMDALVLHACEGHVLSLFREVGSQLGVGFRIETRAHPEGGLQVWLTLIGDHAAALSVIGGTMAALFTAGKWAAYDRPLIRQQRELNELNLKRMRLELKRMEAEAEPEQTSPATGATKPLDLEPPPQIEEVLPALIEKRKVALLRSSFYKSLLNEPRAHAVGFAPMHEPHASQERRVPREQFQSYVLDSVDLPPLTYRKVEIEVVSPVLTRRALKWRGIFERQIISFEITDPDFLARVANKKVVFQNGTTLLCDLVVHPKENEVGDIVSASYVAEKIHKHFTKAVQRRSVGASHEDDQPGGKDEGDQAFSGAQDLFK